MAVKSELSMALVVMMAAAAVGLVVPESLGCIPTPSGGVKYTVGDDFWAIHPNPDYYTNWSSNHFFKIGDSLGNPIPRVYIYITLPHMHY